MALVKQGQLIKPLERIDERGQRVIACLVHGDEQGKPLSIAETAARMKWTQRYIRALLKDPLFKAELAAQTIAARTALQPRAIGRLGELMESDNESIALNSSKAILGDDGKASVSVAVQVNNQTNNTTIRPGYVLDLSALHGRRQSSAPITIEAAPNAD